MKLKVTEAQHQAAVIAWANHQLNLKKWPELALLFHIPNGGSRNRLEAYHLKQQGVKPGVPDLCLPVPRGCYCCLWIEMKSGKGRLSQEQKRWINAFNENGHFAKVCYGAEDAIETLKWYLNLGGKENGMDKRK